MTDQEVRDRAAIAQLLARCTQAGDARKAQDYADCFTEDGVLELAETIAGRAAILAWMRAPSPIPPPAGQTPAFISHHLTTSSVHFVSETEALARTYWLVTGANGLDHNGFYVDRLRKTEDAWLIAHRRPRTLWISPTSQLRG